MELLHKPLETVGRVFYRLEPFHCPTVSQHEEGRFYHASHTMYNY